MDLKKTKERGKIVGRNMLWRNMLENFLVVRMVRVGEKQHRKKVAIKKSNIDMFID